MDDLLNPNLYGALLFDGQEQQSLDTCIRRKDLFRYHQPGSACDEAERLIASVAGAAGAVVVSSGTAAIRAMLHACGVTSGDRVLVSAYTFHATASAVYSLGATPVAIDFDPATNLDLAELSRQMTPRPAAVIAVHWPGRCFDLSAVARVCDGHSVPLLEDAAQAFAAAHGTVIAGRQGVAGAYSFQFGKLVTCGEGGAVVSDDPYLIEHVRCYADHGMRRKPDGLPSPQPADWPGDNLRMTGLQASVLVAQLNKLGALLDRLRATRDELMRPRPGQAFKCWSPEGAGDIGQNILLRFRDETAASAGEQTFRASNILIKRIWPGPFTDAFSWPGEPQNLPGSRLISSCVRLVPLPPTLGRDGLEAIAAAIIGSERLLA